MAEQSGPLTFLEDTARGQCLNGIASTIAALDLPGLADNVWILKVPTADAVKALKRPAVIVTDLPPRYSPADGGVARADVVYRAAVITFRSGNREAFWNEQSAAILAWEQAIFQAFAKTARPFQFAGSVASAGFQNLGATVEPGEPVEVQHWRENLDANVMAVAVKVRFPSSNG